MMCAKVCGMPWTKKERGEGITNCDTPPDFMFTATSGELNPRLRISAFWKTVRPLPALKGR